MKVQIYKGTEQTPTQTRIVDTNLNIPLVDDIIIIRLANGVFSHYLRVTRREWDYLKGEHVLILRCEEAR